MGIHEILGKIFSKISQELASLSEDDLKKLSGEDYTVSIRIVRTRTSAPAADELTDDAKRSLLADLGKAATREDGIQVLEDTLSTRKESEAMARFLDISILKQDKVATIREKIVEATIGARLRSQAIQGKKT